jgi:hypothetical protein
MKAILETFRNRFREIWRRFSCIAHAGNGFREFEKC